MRVVNTGTVTLTGTSWGATIELLGATISLIQAPAALTSTKLNVQSSMDGSTWVVMQKDGNDHQITVAQGKSTKIDPNDFAGVPYVRFQPGSDESTNQRVFKYALSEI